MVCGVSSRSCVNLGEETRSTLGVSSGSGAATDTFGRVFTSSVGVCALAAAADSARLTATAIERCDTVQLPDAVDADPRAFWLSRSGVAGIAAGATAETAITPFQQ